MKNKIFLLPLILFCLSLHVSCSAVSLGSIEHHEQKVEMSDNPEVCIDCHDSQTGKSHHQIAMLYPPKGKEDSFLPVASLPANGIRLFHGKVVCTSCHNLKNPEKSHLVTSNSSSKLCVLCHRK